MDRRARWLLAPALGLVCTGLPGQGAERPGFTFLRQNEDWSRFEPDPEVPDPFDGIKRVPLSDDGSVWASFGGHARLRLEAWNGFAFGAPVGASHDDAFLLTRFMAHGDLHVGETLRVFVEGKSALATDRDLPGGRRPLDVDTAALQQAFADVELPVGEGGSVVLRGGRQMFLFGNQRLVSPLSWSNTLRAWDGFTAILSVDDWSVTGFWSQFVPVDKHDVNSADPGTRLMGAYATREPSADGRLDLYFLGLHRDQAAFNGTAGEEDRYTVGARLMGSIGDGPADYEVEAAAQFGEVGAGDVAAFMFAGVVGWRFETDLSPRAWLGFDYATGDRSPGGDVQTFNQLFPLGHAYLGYIDAIGRQNNIDVSAGVSAKLGPQTTVGLAQHVFWLANDRDALYNAGGGVTRPGGSSTSTYVGTETDVTVTIKADRHTAILLGYSHFFAGSVLEDSGPSDDVDFAYAQVQYTF